MIKKSVTAIFASALIVALSVPAAAKPAEGPISSAEDIRTLHVFADCMVDRFGPSVRRLLAVDFRSSLYDNDLRSLIQVARRCAPFSFGRLRSSRVLVAGALAEQLLPATLNGARLAERVVHDPSKVAIPARDDGEYVGLCTVRMMPDEVAELLATRPASEEEKLAASKIIPRLSACVRTGAAARVNMSGLRALLALAAYRLASQESPSQSRRAGS